MKIITITLIILALMSATAFAAVGKPFTTVGKPFVESGFPVFDYQE